MATPSAYSVVDGNGASPVDPGPLEAAGSHPAGSQIALAFPGARSCPACRRHCRRNGPGTGGAEKGREGPRARFGQSVGAPAPRGLVEVVVGVACRGHGDPSPGIVGRENRIPVGDASVGRAVPEPGAVRRAGHPVEILSGASWGPVDLNAGVDSSARRLVRDPAVEAMRKRLADPRSVSAWRSIPPCSTPRRNRCRIVRSWDRVGSDVRLPPVRVRPWR